MNRIDGESEQTTLFLHARSGMLLGATRISKKKSSWRAVLGEVGVCRCRSARRSTSLLWSRRRRGASNLSQVYRTNCNFIETADFPITIQETRRLVGSAPATAREVCMTVPERGLLSDKATARRGMDAGPIKFLPTPAAPAEPRIKRVYCTISH